MPDKIYIKPPRPTRVIVIAQIVIGALFLPLGILFVVISEGEARIAAAIFSVIWSAICIAMIIYGINILGLIKQGKFQIAEVEKEKTEDFAEELRELEKMKKEGLISDDEYKVKRDEVMKKKW